MQKLTSAFERQEMPVACEPCRQRKRRCDRVIPSCGRCTKTSRQCYYTADRVTKPPEKEKIESQKTELFEIATHRLYYTWAVQSPDSPGAYPIPSRWYMPRLLKQFSEGLGVSRLPVDANSTAYQIQTLWLRSALSDPCLFHATLFAGSSYSDLLRGEGQSQITILHQTELIKLINERLSDPHAALDDRTILSVSPLALFAELNGDRRAADIHRAGLQQMAELRGGLDKLGFNGLSSVLIKMNNIVYSIAFDTDPGCSVSARPIPPPVGLEARILNSTITSKRASRVSPHKCTSLIRDLFWEVHYYKLRYMSQKLAPQTDTQHWGSTNPTISASQDDPIYHCCSLAVQIFWDIINGRTHRLELLTATLTACLALTDDETWLRHYPEAFSWVCLTGAAAVVREVRPRLWFYFKQASSVRLLHLQNETSFLDDLWSHFYWLRTLRLSLEMASVEPVFKQLSI